MMIHKHFKILLKDVFTYGFMGTLGRVVGFLLLPIFTRIFSVEEYGVIDIIAIFTNLVIVGSSLRLSASLSRYFSDDEKVPKLEELFSTLLIFSTFVNILFFTVIFIFSDSISFLLSEKLEYSNYVKLAAGIAFFGSINKLPFMVLRRQRKIILFTTINLCSSILFTILALVSVLWLNFGLVGIFCAQIISNGLTLITALLVTRKLLVMTFNIDYLKIALKYSLPLIPGKFVMWANQQANRIILLYFLGLTGVGLFGVGYRISSVIFILITFFGRAWGPFSVEMLKYKERKFVFEQSLKYYLGLFFSAGIIISALGPELINILTPNEYYSAYVVIPWIIGASIISGSTRIINIGTAISEKTIDNSFSEMIAFIVNLIISYILIKNFGINGAAIGLFFSQIVSKLFLWRSTVRLSEIRFDISFIIKTIIIYIISSIFILLIAKYLSYQFSLSLIIRFIIMIFGITIIGILTKDEFLIAGIKRLVIKNE